MQIWAIQTLNSLALGGLLFLLSSGFALIFGLMRVANLTHGALFMIGAYVAATTVRAGHNLFVRRSRRSCASACSAASSSA
jgi:branched-chain amino acid transport system permease protein